jgi:hypothetical protein
MTITLTREEAQQVLDALESAWYHVGAFVPTDEAIDLYDAAKETLRARLAQPEPEPVAIDGNTSDGYHTFNELYEFRKAYNVALFNEWAAIGKHSVHKSFRHYDGELCFGGGWFIVVAVLPNGQISNHYDAKDWDLFNVPIVEKALFEFDGHTGSDVIARLTSYTAPPQREWQGLTDEEIEKIFIWQEWGEDFADFEPVARAIEAKLREKNA